MKLQFIITPEGEILIETDESMAYYDENNIQTCTDNPTILSTINKMKATLSENKQAFIDNKVDYLKSENLKLNCIERDILSLLLNGSRSFSYIVKTLKKHSPSDLHNHLHKLSDNDYICWFLHMDIINLTQEGKWLCKSNNIKGDGINGKF